MNLEEKLISNHYKVKTISAQIEDFDAGSRKVKVVLNTMNFLDSDRDVIRNGAFVKSISERGAKTSSPDKIQFLRHHDWQQQIGKYTEMYEKGDELIGVGILSKSTQGNNALEDYDLGVINQHSIGFQYLKDKISFVKDSQLHKEGHYEVKEVKLFEGSAVAFGANKLTPTLDVAKSTGDYEPVFKMLNDLCNTFSKALKFHKGTDEHIKGLEYQFLQIQEIQNSLKFLEPSLKDTLKGEPRSKSVLDYLLTK